MDFQKKIDIFKKMLFIGYERTDKIKVDDWYDEAVDLATLVSSMKSKDSVEKEIKDYLEDRFKKDTYTDFVLLSKKMSDKIYDHL